MLLLPAQQGLEVRARHPDHDPRGSAEADDPLVDAGFALQLGLNFVQQNLFYLKQAKLFFECLVT